MLVGDTESSVLALSILLFTAWKKKDLSNLDGEMSVPMTEAVREGGIITLPNWEKELSLAFKSSGTISSIGNLSESEAVVNHIMEVLYRKSWTTRWLAIPVALILPKDRREEWLGDLYDLYNNKIVQKYPPFVANLIVICRTLGSSVCVMQWTGVIRDGTLIEKGI
ncbi:hypothetical protein MICAB_2910016 [Microcystis aeruginosa PCC 9717]|uniref:Uncharacterized protein n=1 Tax=Microcystis aeruginosa PCC 9717 TaxID=1160286 RepID=I4FN48_MICAE|nr:hypothetical protein MICAB_2910016 [Microcystis aeruginosa PCC 9717]